jgi:hypothetical protein
VSFDGHELDAAARERLMSAGAEFVAELELAADGATDTPGITFRLEAEDAHDAYWTARDRLGTGRIEVRRELH